MYIDDLLVKLTEFERSVPWMYRDTVGLVTVGVGNMLPDVAAACALPFRTAIGLIASPELVTADFTRVSAMPAGHTAMSYRTPSSLMLDARDIDQLLRRRVSTFEDELRSIFPGYDDFPATGKIGLLDMIFNLGKGYRATPPAKGKGLLAYGHLIGAIERGDWAAAASESARNSGNPAFATRNEWTRQQFLSAV